jgi:sugar O-acyltransferase (sialic acid O-acetyltransferase NeuD family)
MSLVRVLLLVEEYGQVEELDDSGLMVNEGVRFGAMTGPERNNKTVIFGAGDFGEVLHHMLVTGNDFDVNAFVVDDDQKSTSRFCGLPVVSRSEAIDAYPPDQHSMMIAVGYSKMNENRKSIFEWAQSVGYTLASYVSPNATVAAGVRIGSNCIVFEGNTLQPFVEIHDNVILWSGNHIGHHSVIESDVFVSSHCVVSGSCRIGRGSFLGVNCTLQDGVRIGRRCFVGPSSLVRTDLEDDAVVIAPSTSVSAVRSTALDL